MPRRQTPAGAAGGRRGRNGGVHTEDVASPIGQYDAVEFLECAREKWKAVTVAAHVASKGGLLRVLSGQPRIQAWRSVYLLACSLPGPTSDAPAELRPILENTNPDYHRNRAVAVVNAQDVCDPEDLAQASASCWIKKSEVSVAGLHQAFLDPISRIRLASDPAPEEHTEFVAMAWQGGFLDGTVIHFNQNLNVLIGGRGTGKSTVIESLRHVLGLSPLTEDGATTHQGVVRHVLGNATKISLRVRSHHPARRDYVIERTIPNPPVVRDDRNQQLAVTPLDIVPQVEIYGQHEISDLTKDSEKLTRLLDRFVTQDQDLDTRRSDLRRELARSRRRVLDGHHETVQVQDRLAALPALEETLKRFQDAGLEDRLKEQSLLVREERILKTAEQRLEPFRDILDQLRRALPIDRAFLSQKALEDLPGKAILARSDRVLQEFHHEMESLVTRYGEALVNADAGLAEVGTDWDKRKQRVLEAYEQILRDLQKSKIDGAEFMRLRQQIEELQPLRERLAALQRDLREHEEHRRKLLTEWNDLRSEEYRQLERAAKKVNRKLAGIGPEEPLLAAMQGPFAPNYVAVAFREGVASWTVHPWFHAHRGAEVRQANVARFETRVQPDGDNLIAVLHTLYTSDREFKNEINTAMKAAFGEEFEELVFPPAADQRIQLRVRWKSLTHEVSAADLSDGTLRFLFLLAVLANPKPPALIAIDEPETGLHPSMLRIVAEYARDAASRTQVVLTTHSPDFLDAFGDEPPTTTVVDCQDGQTQLRVVGGDELDYWLKEYSLGELYRCWQLEAIT